jgi:hypothetical protein
MVRVVDVTEPTVLIFWLFTFGSSALVTVKVADAVLALTSVAVTVFAPTDKGGTLNDAEKPPAAFVVIVAGIVVCVTPLYFRVVVDVEAKPAPVTVTDEPTFPLAGANEIEGVTVKKAEAVFELASVALTV